MSIQTELTRITNAKAAIKTAIEGKGVTVPDGTMLDGMAAMIESIEAGGGGGVKIGNFTTVNYGSFQLAEDVSSYTIDLGYNGSGSVPVVEQFIILRDMPSTFMGTDTKNSLAIAAILSNVKSSNSTISKVIIASYYNSSGTISTSTGNILSFNSNSSDTIPRTMTVTARNANASCVLTAGATYNWIVLRRDK